MSDSTKHPGAKNLNRGGRPKGSPNKSTKAYRDTLVAANFDPAQAAMDMFNDPEVSHDIKLKLLQMMTEFSSYKPKQPVEGEAAKDSESDTPTEVSPEERESLIKLASIGN